MSARWYRQGVELPQLLTVVLLLLVVVSAIAVARAQHHVRDLHTELQQLRKQHAFLVAEWGRSSLEESKWQEEIESRARERLGMILPSPEKMLVLP
jgi:cell division protein FtsL